MSIAAGGNFGRKVATCGKSAEIYMSPPARQDAQPSHSSFDELHIELDPDDVADHGVPRTEAETEIAAADTTNPFEGRMWLAWSSQHQAADFIRNILIVPWESDHVTAING